MRGTIKYEGKPENHLKNGKNDIFSAYTMLKNYNIWPVDRGLITQTAKFIKCVKFCDNVFSRYEEIEKAENELKQRMQDNLNKSLKRG